MTVADAIQRVQSMYSHGVHSKDTRLTSRHIYSSLCSVRANLIQQMYSKNQNPGEWSYQPLQCVELVQSNLQECPCITDPACSILRTKSKLPKIVEGLSGSIVRVVSDSEGKARYDMTTFENAKYNVGNKYTADKPNFLIYNEYGFLTRKKYLKSITIVAPWVDPIEAYLFPSICEDEDAPCKDIYELTFPIDGRLEKSLIDLANEECIRLFAQTNEDSKDDAKDNTTTTGRMIHDQNTDGR